MVSRPARRSVLSVLAAVATAAVLAACGDDATPGGSPDGGAEVRAGAPVEDRAALEHIHGLGVNPADGTLFIATHHGLFTARDGETTPQRTGESSQDIMGFSVVGKDHFIGSGHPAPDQELPPHLGLIESRDGGKTWENVSLLGEADFHVLEESGGKIYGFDGTQGRLMVSSDGGRDWQERTPPAGVFGLAVDPGRPSRIIASTEQGVFISADEGRRWKPLRNDLGGLLAWPSEKRLYLVDGQGQVHSSSDGGKSFQREGSIDGQPAAFIADGGELYAALVDGTVKVSTDGGSTWAVRTTAS